MAPVIRPLTAADAPDVLRINKAVVQKLAPLDEPKYHWFVADAACAWGAQVGDELAGFVFVLEPGAAYDSANYRWFSEHVDDFLYLDRIAVDAAHRRTGVAGAIYDQVEALAEAGGRPVLLEVNEIPRNDGSLAFHADRGYRSVGTLAHDDGAKVVRLLRWDPDGQVS